MITAQLWKPYESIKKFVPQCEVRGKSVATILRRLATEDRFGTYALLVDRKDAICHALGAERLFLVVNGVSNMIHMVAPLFDLNQTLDDLVGAELATALWDIYTLDW